MAYTVVEPATFVHEREDNHHDILFYDSTESKSKILYGYLIEGLLRNKGVVYIRSESTRASILESFKEHEVDPEKYLHLDMLKLVDFDDFYIINDRVEPMRIMSRWLLFKDDFTSMGYGMRATGETDCFFKEDRVRDLMKYEYTIRKVPSFPVDVLCLYNLNTIVESGHTDFIMPLVRAHGKAIFASETGTIVMEPERTEVEDLEKLMQIDI